MVGWFSDRRQVVVDFSTRVTTKRIPALDHSQRIPIGSHSSIGQEDDLVEESDESVSPSPSLFRKSARP